MKIRHPAVKSNVLKLVGTYELDLDLGPELNFPLRFEVFRDTERRGCYRIHVWELECFNIEPAFPGKRNGKRRRYQSTETLLLERATQLSGSYHYFAAKTEADALAKVIKDLKGRLARWTLIKAK